MTPSSVTMALFIPFPSRSRPHTRHNEVYPTTRPRMPNQLLLSPCFIFLCSLVCAGCNVSFDDNNVCGDGIVEPTEQCDGDSVPCSELGMSGNEASCLNDCTLDLGQCWTCGDGICSRSAGENQGNCHKDCPVPTRLTAGAGHTCLLTKDASLWCWGGNWSGQLGTGDTQDRPTPCPIDLAGPQPQSAQSIWAGKSHTCLLDAGGTLWCWGSNEHGESGGNAHGQPSSPVAVMEEDVVDACGGDYHTCAVIRGKGVSCWGWNLAGQLGVEDVETSDIPLEVSGLVDAVQVTCGSAHTCALTASGAVWCWGSNYYGQLGRITAEVTSLPVLAAEGFSGISAGAFHTCAWTSQGEIWCWGANSQGQLADGTRADSSQPRTTLLPKTAIRVSCGDEFCCMETIDDHVICWGQGDHGQLGIGESPYQDLRNPTNTIEEALTVECGANHCCAIKRNWSLLCWGANESGQLGNSSNDDQYGPMEVPLDLVECATQ